MAKLTISDAARVAGVARSTLHRAIKAGRLSADPDGQPDTAELLRAGYTLQAQTQQEHASPLQDATPRDRSVQHLSLSRLNHGLPSSQAHPEVVQGTAECHHQIADAFFPQADAVCDDAAALATALDMLEPQPPLVECLVRPGLLLRALLAAWLLGRHEALHLWEREGQQAQLL